MTLARISFEELVSLVSQIQSGCGSEEEEDARIQELCDRVSDPEAVNYIFYDDLSAEQVATKILQYKPQTGLHCGVEPHLINHSKH